MSIETPDNILLVGAGAVGQAYGRHLQLGGARVTFLVKPKYAAEARAGFTVYPLNTKAGKRREPTRFEGFEVIEDAAEAAGRAWGQVWLCLSATALRGAWFDTLVGAIGDATLVSLTPGLEDHAYVTERYPEERVVSGMINMVSYQAPLATETVPEPGVAYWFPSKSPFSGPTDARVRGVVAALRRGGCPAKRVKDAGRTANFGSAVLMPLLVGLEASSWSFRELRRGPHLKVSLRAAREALRVVASYREERRPLYHPFIRPTLIRLLTLLAPKVMPLDVETYFAYHFTKVGDQTAFMLDRYATVGAERGLETAALSECHDLLEAARADATPPVEAASPQRSASG